MRSTRERQHALWETVVLNTPRDGSQRINRARQRWLTYVKLDADGCWMWTGTLSRQGYAVFGWSEWDPQKGLYRPSRSAFWFLIRNWFPERYWPNHLGNKASETLCGKRLCVSPLCRKLVPYSRMLYRKSTLTPEQVVEIRHSDLPATELAAWYGVTRKAITDIVFGRKWKTVGGPIREYHRGRKLTDAQAAEIYRLRNHTRSATRVGNAYGVDARSVRRIWEGKTYRNITQEGSRRDSAEPTRITRSRAARGSGSVQTEAIRPTR